MRTRWIWAALVAAACAHPRYGHFAPLPAPVATMQPKVSPCDSAPPPAFDAPPTFETPKPFETAPSFPAPPPPAVAEPPQFETPAAFPTPPAPSPCD
jgi:hypothetical protein